MSSIFRFLFGSSSTKNQTKSLSTKHNPEFITLSEIPTWEEYVRTNLTSLQGKTFFF